MKRQRMKSTGVELNALIKERESLERLIKFHENYLFQLKIEGNLFPGMEDYTAAALTYYKNMLDMTVMSINKARVYMPINVEVPQAIA